MFRRSLLAVRLRTSYKTHLNVEKNHPRTLCCGNASLLITENYESHRKKAVLPSASLPRLVQVSRGAHTYKSPYYEFPQGDNFDNSVPPFCNFTNDVIDQWAEREKRGERNDTIPALWFLYDNDKEIKWTFSDVSSYAKRIANLLHNTCNLNKGDVLMLLLPRTPEWWIIYAGAIKLGLTVALASSQLRSKDIGFRMRQGKIKCVITIPELMDEVDQVVDGTDVKAKIVIRAGEANRPLKNWHDFDKLLEASSEDFELTERTKCTDPLLLYYTSGTTGNPKMVMQTFGNYSLIAKHVSYVLKIKPSNILLPLSDPGWAFLSFAGFFGAWQAGSCVFALEQRRFDPAKLLETIHKYPVSHMSAPPTVYRMVLKSYPDQKYNTQLRGCLSAGEKMDVPTFNAWKERTGVEIQDVYGQSETTALMAAFSDIEAPPGSSGKITPFMPVKILDDEENEVGPNTEGNIAIKIKPFHPWGLFTEYRNDPEKTKEVFQGEYYYTGDRAYYDENGYCWIVGRADDIIKSSGYRIGPSEVEYAIMEHPFVAEVAVVGSPDPQRGEVVKAFIVLKEQYKNHGTEDLIKEIQQLVKKSTAAYKTPRKVEFVDSLPKTDISGKVKRKVLKLREKKAYEEALRATATN